MKTVCDVIAMLGALGAAGFWFWSAFMRVPDFLQMSLSGENSPTGWMKKQSLYSAIGAMLAGISAIAQAVGYFLEISN